MSYKCDSIVNKSEANALKEMIFRRVRERNESMGEETQNDVMEMARESFVSKDNPFSQIAAAATKAVEEEPKAENTTPLKKEIGFPQKQLKARAVEQKRILEENITTSTVQNNMIEARNTLSSRKSFIGALNFLNSQAAVSLMRTRGDKFEVVA